MCRNCVLGTIGKFGSAIPILPEVNEILNFRAAAGSLCRDGDATFCLYFQAGAKDARLEVLACHMEEEERHGPRCA